MPPIRDHLLETVIYLYPSVADAVSGTNTGGSGFLVGLPADGAPLLEENQPPAAIIAVSNRHVVGDPAQSPVIRLNTLAGRVEVLEMTGADWIAHPDGDDLAICPLGVVPDGVKFNYLRRELFIKRASDGSPHFTGLPGSGPPVFLGSGVFMVGRFMPIESRVNQPVVRFGDIAMLPAPIRSPRGIDQESYLVEMHSVSGFSGSPVFIGTYNELGSLAQRFLGVDWGHIPHVHPVLDADARHPSYTVEQNSGMMMVIPSWKLEEMLDSDEINEWKDEQIRDAEQKKAEWPVVYDAEEPGRDTPIKIDMDPEDALRRLLNTPKVRKPDSKK